MGAPDPNAPGPQAPQGYDGRPESEPVTAADAGAPPLAGMGVSDPEEARRLIEAQCCSRWPI